MNDKIKNKKTIAYGIGILFFVALFIAFFPSKSESNILASDEVFNDVDFQSKNADVDARKIDYEDKNKEYLKKVQLSDDQKIAIIKAIENSKFERISISDTFIDEYDYSVYIKLNKLYELYLDSTHKILVFANEYDNDSDHLYYKISNDSDLFKILEESAKGEKIYTMQEALTSDVYTPNFDVEEKSLTVSTKRIEGEDLKDLTPLTELAISKEDEQELIKEIEQFKLIKYDDNDIIQALKEDSYYSLYLTISTGYRLTLNSKNKTIYVSDENIAQGYKIQNGDKFFTLLEKIKE